ncbi:MAG: zinc-ribbon domain-containing protein [Lachnospiraceae bacterium]|nr:zinc-ribbon domain-containing protein [Lachnospiraceae bacterium]
MSISLAEASPALCEEWSEKNEPLTPKDVTSGSGRKVWWKGACGHEWEAAVKSRTRGHGCPYCTGRVCAPGRNDLATTHPELAKEWSKKNGSLTPDQVAYGTNKIVWWKGPCGHEWKQMVKSRSRGRGCPVCAGKIIVADDNDLASKHPEIAAEWSERNLPLQPTRVPPRSDKHVWWTCRDCGRDWKARIADRSAGTGCPYCNPNGKLVSGENDLVTLYPQIANEWSDWNFPLMPHGVKPLSPKCVWWKCSICGHEWPAKIESRVRGRAGCPECKKHLHLVRKMKINPVSALLYYAAQTGTEAKKNDESLIGLPLDIFMPTWRAAIACSQGKQKKADYRREVVINDLCRKSSILLIRILDKNALEHDTCRCITRLDDSDESLSDAIAAVFRMLCIDADIDITRDREEILQYDGQYIEGVNKIRRRNEAVPAF